MAVGIEAISLPSLENFPPRQYLLGVDPLGCVIHSLEDKRALEKNNPLILLASLVLVFDEDIKQSRNLFTEVLEEGEVREIKHGLVESVEGVLEETEDAVVTGALYGAYLLVAGLNPKYQNRAFFAPISSTDGAEAGKARFVGEVDERMLDEENCLIFLDDIIDTASTLAQIVLERREKRLVGEVGQEYESLVKKLGKTFGKDFNQFGELYRKLARLMKEENVLSAAVFSKNQPLKEIIKKTAEKAVEKGELGKEGEWGRRQLDLIEKTHELDQRDWVVGAGLLDSGVDWLEIYELLLPEVQAVFHRCGFGEDGLFNVKFRLGASIERLLALKQHKERGPDGKVRYKIDVLKKQFADFLSEFVFPPETSQE